MMTNAARHLTTPSTRVSGQSTANRTIFFRVLAINVPLLEFSVQDCDKKISNCYEYDLEPPVLCCVTVRCFAPGCPCSRLSKRKSCKWTATQLRICLSIVDLRRHFVGPSKFCSMIHMICSRKRCAYYVQVVLFVHRLLWKTQFELERIVGTGNICDILSRQR